MSTITICSACGAELKANSAACQRCATYAAKPEHVPFNDVPKVTEEKPRTLRLECKPSDRDELLHVLGSSNLVSHITVTPMSVQVMSIHEHEICLVSVKLKTKQQLKDEESDRSQAEEAAECAERYIQVCKERDELKFRLEGLDK